MKPNLLRVERKRRGWSQADVAEALGITTKTVVRWERGDTVPFPYHRYKLSDLFGKTLQELGLLSDADENDVRLRGLDGFRSPQRGRKHEAGEGEQGRQAPEAWSQLAHQIRSFRVDVLSSRPPPACRSHETRQGGQDR